MKRKGDRMTNPGLFIVCEGIDGCGKGTQAGLLVDRLFKMNKRHHVLYTREPARSNYGVSIRQILKEQSDPYQRGILMAELFVEDRKKHVRELVDPVLRYGGIVACDRYSPSTYTYQQMQGIPLDVLVKMHEGLLIPDLTVIFDLDAEEAMRRQAQDEKRDYAELFEKRDVQVKLRQLYLELPGKLPNHRIEIVNASRTREEIHEEVFALVKPLLSKVA